MQPLQVLSKDSLARRAYWVDEIVRISGHFGEDTSRVEAELASEVQRDGVTALIDHLRLCGSIPEQYGHDTSEENCIRNTPMHYLLLHIGTLGSQVSFSMSVQTPQT